MPERKVVAILAASPALSCLLAMVIASDQRLHVRQCFSDDELIAYMRVAPVDILICDFDREGRPAWEMVEFIRLDSDIVTRDVQVMALSRTITPPMRHHAISAGIDEVVIKPMSPRHMLQRVRARLRTRPIIAAPGSYHGPDRRNRIAYPDRPPAADANNVIELFSDRRRPVRSAAEQV